MATKKIVGRAVLLSYPIFSEYFITHADASKIQIRGVIEPKRKARFLLLAQPCTNQIYNYRKKTVTYNGNPKIIP